MYYNSHVFLSVLNSIFNTVSAWVDDVFFTSRCVKLHFAYTCSVTVNVKRLSWHSACAEQKFANTIKLKLGAFLLKATCLKLNVVCAYYLKMDAFSLGCFSRCFKHSFANRSSVRLDVFLLPCDSSCVNLILCTPPV